VEGVEHRSVISQYFLMNSLYVIRIRLCIDCCMTYTSSLCYHNLDATCSPPLPEIIASIDKLGRLYLKAINAGPHLCQRSPGIVVDVQRLSRSHDAGVSLTVALLRVRLDTMERLSFGLDTCTRWVHLGSVVQRADGRFRRWWVCLRCQELLSVAYVPDLAHNPYDPILHVP
jgi:hypothetical protein